jgi:hypothetical protein
LDCTISENIQREGIQNTGKRFLVFIKENTITSAAIMKNIRNLLGVEEREKFILG